MHNTPTQPVHDAVAMAVVVVRRDPEYRYERVRLLLADGSVYQLAEIAVPHGDNSLTLRSAAWSLKQHRIGRRKATIWRQINAKPGQVEISR